MVGSNSLLARMHEMPSIDWIRRIEALVCGGTPSGSASMHGDPSSVISASSWTCLPGALHRDASGLLIRHRVSPDVEVRSFGDRQLRRAHVGHYGRVHRYLAHCSFHTSRVFQFVLALLGTTAMQNGPIWWASWHRRHHKYVDTIGDPHSPPILGFWYAHFAWVFDPKNDETDLSNVRDLTCFPELGCSIDSPGCRSSRGR